MQLSHSSPWGLSAAGHAPLSRVSPVRDAPDLRRLIGVVERLRSPLGRTGVATAVADELLAKLRRELHRITPAYTG